MYPEWTKVTEKNQTRRPTLPQGAQYDLQLDEVGSTPGTGPMQPYGRTRASGTWWRALAHQFVETGSGASFAPALPPRCWYHRLALLTVLPWHWTHYDIWGVQTPVGGSRPKGAAGPRCGQTETVKKNTGLVKPIPRQPPQHLEPAPMPASKDLH